MIDSNDMVSRFQDTSTVVQFGTIRPTALSSLLLKTVTFEHLVKLLFLQKKKLAWKDNLQRHKLVAPSIKCMHLSFVISQTFLIFTLFNEKNIKFMT